ncbi:MAG: hypothetical protein JXA54_01095 [Candidatus Heimdallarchaeota archaeon]|nr:hypothetical protein [Candidatus Heimdallarchaeota archaeon]
MVDTVVKNYNTDEAKLQTSLSRGNRVHLLPKNDLEQSGSKQNPLLNISLTYPIIPQFNPSMPDKQRRFEIYLVILTGLGKILFVGAIVLCGAEPGSVGGVYWAFL